MTSSILDTILTVIIRRGLTLLGTAGASVSDDWVVQTVSLIVVAINEIRQAHKAHKARAVTP